MIFQTPTIGPEEQAAVEAIEGLRSQLRFYVTEPRRWVGMVRRVLAARAIQGSNSIEGYNVSVEDAIAAIEGHEPMEADEVDWQAVTSYRRAMTYVLQIAHDGDFEYSSSLLKSLHFMMTEYTLDAGPGLWRPGSVWVRNEATGDVVYEGPAPESVAGLIDELIDDLNEAGDVLPSIAGAMAHLNLVMIHPFRDGNGRMARGLQTLVLAREGIVAPEFASIEEYLGRNTDRYYGVLSEVGAGSWNPHRDARPWIRFCLEAHYIQAATVLRRIKESEKMWAAVDELATERGVPERAIGALLDAAVGLRVRNSSYRAAVDAWTGEQISNQVATNDLRALVDAGFLEKRGEKRGTDYVPAEPLREIRERVRSNRLPIDATDLFVPNQPSLFG